VIVMPEGGVVERREHQEQCGRDVESLQALRRDAKEKRNARSR
jgi:hypothetical protein